MGERAHATQIMAAHISRGLWRYMRAPAGRLQACSLPRLQWLRLRAHGRRRSGSKSGIHVWSGDDVRDSAASACIMIVGQSLSSTPICSNLSFDVSHTAGQAGIQARNRRREPVKDQHRHALHGWHYRRYLGFAWHPRISPASSAPADCIRQAGRAPASGRRRAAAQPPAKTQQQMGCHTSLPQ